MPIQKERFLPNIEICGWLNATKELNSIEKWISENSWLWLVILIVAAGTIAIIISIAASQLIGSCKPRIRPAPPPRRSQAFVLDGVVPGHAEAIPKPEVLVNFNYCTSYYLIRGGELQSLALGWEGEERAWITEENFNKL